MKLNDAEKQVLKEIKEIYLINSVTSRAIEGVMLPFDSGVLDGKLDYLIHLVIRWKSMLEDGVIHPLEGEMYRGRIITSSDDIPEDASERLMGMAKEHLNAAKDSLSILKRRVCPSCRRPF